MTITGNPRSGESVETNPNELGAIANLAEKIFISSISCLEANEKLYWTHMEPSRAHEMSKNFIDYQEKFIKGEEK
jgi:hypothetical protein